jgi:hypothetical protein
MKTFKQFLSEQPKTIKSTPQRWVNRVQKVWDSRKHKATLVDPARHLWHIGDDYNGYYISEYKDKVAYFAQHTTVKIRVTDQKFSRQIFIARNEDPLVSGLAVHTIDLPREIFFNHLLPKFDGMISDTEQTDDGKRFWLNAVRFALSHPEKYGIRVFNHLRKPAQFLEITNAEDWAEVVDNLWGTTDVFKKITIGIYLK